MNKSKSKNHYAYLKKPDICDELVSTTEMVHSWYLKPKKKKEEVVYTEDPETIRQIELRKEREIYKKMLNDFCNSYYNINERQPFDDEIIENMKTHIPDTILHSLMEQRKQNIIDEELGLGSSDDTFRKPRKAKTMNDI